MNEFSIGRDGIPHPEHVVLRILLVAYAAGAVAVVLMATLILAVLVL